MPLKKFFLFSFIKFNRYILQKRFIRIFRGPLKGYLWSTSSNYDYLTGEYDDPEVLQTFISWLKPDSVFYDLGANVGYYSLIAEQRITSGTVHSFEPMPRNLEIFKEHISLNKEKLDEKKIFIQPFAITDSDREICFSDDEKAIEGNTYINSSDRFKNASRKFLVPGYSIDSLLEKGFRVPDIIKIDVEGAEYDVLKGAVNTLSAHHPKILLATHDCHLPGVKDKCIAFLQSFGYSLYHTGNYNKHAPGHDDYIAV